MKTGIERSIGIGLISAWLALSGSPSLAQIGVIDKGCVLRSIELDDQGREALLSVHSDGDPSSIGARVEPEGVVLDLAGCTPGPELTGGEFAEGLVAALQIQHGSTQDAPIMLVIRIRGAFDYSVSSRPGAVLVSLRGEGHPPPSVGDSFENSESAEGSTLPTSSESSKVRVLEPLAAPPSPKPSVPSSPLLPPSLLKSTPQVPPVEPLPPVGASSPPIAASESEVESEKSAISRVVEDWAQAWSEQRVEDYLATYSSSFQPPEGFSRALWRSQRRQRLTSPSFIEVNVDHLEVRIFEPDRAVARFLQAYRSDTFSDQVQKILTLTREADDWRILREESREPGEAFEWMPDSTGEIAAGGASVAPTPELSAPNPSPAPSDSEASVASRLVEGARLSITKAPTYDASYQFLAYPGGDPGWQRGSGSDLVIRAYRQLGVDLQQRLHEDILAARGDYGIEEPDTNIDHRRIRNLVTFLRRHGQALGLGREADWRPGDIVFWATDGKRRSDHLGIVSGRRGSDGHPLVIHHGEAGSPAEEDVLFAWAVRGHFRWLPTEL